MCPSVCPSVTYIHLCFHPFVYVCPSVCPSDFTFVSVCLYICLYMCVRLLVCTFVSVCQFVHLCPSVCLSVHLCPSVHLFVHLCPPVCSPVCILLSACLSICFYICVRLSICLCICFNTSDHLFVHRRSLDALQLVIYTFSYVPVNPLRGFLAMFTSTFLFVLCILYIICQFLIFMVHDGFRCFYLGNLCIHEKLIYLVIKLHHFVHNCNMTFNR